MLSSVPFKMVTILCPLTVVVTITLFSKHYRWSIIGLYMALQRGYEQLQADVIVNTRTNVGMNICDLSYDVASGSQITPCNKIDKPLMVYRFTGNVITSITTLRT